jgi:hypothetical protein
MSFLRERDEQKEEEEQAALDALLDAQTKQFNKNSRTARKRKLNTKRKFLLNKQKELNNYKMLIKNERVSANEIDSALEVCVDDMLRECLKQDLKDEAIARGFTIEYGESMYRALSWPNE